jgi:hypothetical protein
MSIIAGAMQGIGQGVADVGKMMTTNYFDEEKEKRLDAIKAKWYDKERADRAADKVEEREYQRTKGFEDRANTMSDYGAKRNIDAGYDGDEKSAKIDYYKSMAEENRAKAGYYSDRGRSGAGAGKQEWDDVTTEFTENDVKSLRETGKRADGSSLGSDYRMNDGQIMIDRKVNPNKPATQAQLNELNGKGIVANQIGIKGVTDLAKIKEMIDMTQDPDEKAALEDMYRSAINVNKGTKLNPLPSALR